MATWTELIGAATADDGHDADRVVLPGELRELLLDLPHHPSLCRLRAVTLHLDGGCELTLDLPAGESMASGASGPIAPGAGVQRDTVQPWRVTTVLGDAGTPNIVPASEVGLGAGWLDGLTWAPKVETAPEKSPIILETK